MLHLQVSARRALHSVHPLRAWLIVDAEHSLKGLAKFHLGGVWFGKLLTNVHKMGLSEPFTHRGEVGSQRATYSSLLHLAKKWNLMNHLLTLPR